MRRLNKRNSESSIKMENERAKVEVRKLTDELNKSHDTITEIYSSTSWKLTVPIRFLKEV